MDKLLRKNLTLFFTCAGVLWVLTAVIAFFLLGGKEEGKKEEKTPAVPESARAQVDSGAI